MLLAFAARTRAIDDEADLRAIFAPWRTNIASLSPDGRHLAYPVLGDDGSDRLVLVAVDDPGQKATVDLSGYLGQRASVRVTALQWVTPDQLAFSVDSGYVLAVAADGSGLRSLVGPETVASRAQLSQDRRRQPPSRVANGWDITNGPLPAEVAPPGRRQESPLSFKSPIDPGAAAEAPGGAQGQAQQPVDSTGSQLVLPSAPPPDPIPRFPVLEPFLPSQPGEVLVEAKGWDAQNPDFSIPTSLYRVSLAGVVTEVWNSGSTVGDVLYDRQEQPRVLLDGISGIDQSFQGATGQTGRTGWENLDLEFGTGASFRINPRNYAEARSFPLGFGEDPNVLYVASNAGRDTFGLYAVDARTGKRTDWSMEDPGIDLADLDWARSGDNLVFDRRGKLVAVRYAGVNPRVRWLDEDLARVQSALDAKFPGRFAQIVDWDDGRSRVLVLVYGDADPGRFYVYDRPLDEVTEFVRRAPEVAPEEVNPAIPVRLVTASGVKLTGYLTLPTEPRVRPIPLIVFCHDGPWERVAPGYHREAQALAAGGFAVWEVNYRGSSGFGLGFRDALEQGLDRVPLQDVLESVTSLAARYPVDPRHLGIYGRGFGGYLALRALQLYPERFRGAVAVGAPVDLPYWRDAQGVETEIKNWNRSMDEENAIEETESDEQGIFGEGEGVSPDLIKGELIATISRLDKSGYTLAPAARADMEVDAWRAFLSATKQPLGEISPVRHPELITQPLLLIEDPHDAAATLRPARRLADELRSRRAPFRYLELPGAYVGLSPSAADETASVATDFFNLTLYDFKVKAGRPHRVGPAP